MSVFLSRRERNDALDCHLGFCLHCCKIRSTLSFKSFLQRFICFAKEKLPLDNKTFQDFISSENSSDRVQEAFGWFWMARQLKSNIRSAVEVQLVNQLLWRPDY